MLLGLIATLPAAAFDPPEVTEGDVTLRIEGPESFDAGPLDVVVIVDSQEGAATGTVRLRLIAPWKASPVGQPFAASPGHPARLTFTLEALAPPYNALYPVHAHAEVSGGERLHAVLIVPVHHENPPRAEAPSFPGERLHVPHNGVLPLWNAPIHQTFIDVNEDEGVQSVAMPNAWEGSDGNTRAALHMNQRIDRGGLEPAISMHPPYYGGIDGAIRTEFPLELPNTSPLRLTFRYALRDHNAAAGEPPSDGATFRVRVAADDEAGKPGEIHFEEFTDAKTWRDGQVDLTPFAGAKVGLQLEIDPGPARDNTCDQVFWGRPRIEAGTPAPEGKPDFAEAHNMGVRLGFINQAGVVYTVLLHPGERGMLDGTVRFVSPHGDLAFRGFAIEAGGDALHEPGGLWRLRRIRREAGVEDRWVHHFTRGDAALDLVARFWLDRGALHIAWGLENAPAPQPWHVTRITHAALGPWNSGVYRVYAGVGNVLQEPEAFTLPFDGHQLATSHVGCDFDNSFALIQSTDTPPLHLEVVPGEDRFSLVAEDATTFTLVPSANVWMAARVWRGTQKRAAAPDVPALAGRFVFDLWWGNYAERAKQLAQAFDHGLTNSVVIWHNWQRWGYDYRLPDILPRNPAFGTEAEFRELIQVCRDHNVPFVLHDNYIDIYPDASVFAYEKVAMTPHNEPVRGWFNTYREAQSYRWRPDKFLPVLDANVSRIATEYMPGGYFVDVWASIRPHGFWSHDGAYTPATVTREIWGAAFDRIRMLLNGAPTLSESGTDQLIGHVAGATTNHLRVDPAPPGDGHFTWRVHAEDTERIPWLDMAWHDRFVLHGAGYEDRYAAGLDIDRHGIFSDDYICTEVLTGHPGMVNAAFNRDVVRKYWLLDGFARALAGVPMGWVAFVEDDIHRQYVHWENGGDVWVNRGGDDWQGQTHRLPPFGFYATIPREAPHTEAAIEYVDGVIAEWARTPDAFYVNARPPDPTLAPVRLEGATITQNGAQSTLTLTWVAERPLAADYHVYVHAVDESGAIQFQGDHAPGIPTSTWANEVNSTATLTLPENAEPGDSWHVRAGLYVPGSGERLQLQNSRDRRGNVPMGTLKVVRKSDAGLEAQLVPPAPPSVDTRARVNHARKVLDFGSVATDGACRITSDKGQLVVTPLPGSEAFTLLLRNTLFLWPFPEEAALMARDPEDAAVTVAQTDAGEWRLAIPAGTGKVFLRAQPAP